MYPFIYFQMKLLNTLKRFILKRVIWIHVQGEKILKCSLVLQTSTPS